MKPAADIQAAPPSVPAGPPVLYSDQLAALEARRRAADDLLLRRMLDVRSPMNPSPDA